MKTFKLHLIRHGLTRGNLEGLYVGGGTDLPLCPEGKQQLLELRSTFRYPQVDTVVSSPLLRATQTADILFPDVPHKLVIDQLRENHFGIYEGRPMQELLKDPDFARWMDPTSGFVPQDAEPLPVFHTRCADTLTKLFHYMVQSHLSEMACVTHGGVIMSMLAQKALPQRRPEDWMADPGCGYTVQCDAAMLMRDQMVEAIEILPYGYLDD